MNSQAHINAVLIKRAWNKWDAMDTATDFVPFVGSTKDMGKGVWDLVHGNWKSGLGNLAGGVVGLGLDVATGGAAGLLKGGIKAVGKAGIRGGAKALGETAAKNWAAQGLKGTMQAGVGNLPKALAYGAPAAAGGLYVQNKATTQQAGEDAHEQSIQDINASRSAQGMPAIQRPTQQPSHWYNPMTWGGAPPATSAAPVPAQQPAPSWQTGGPMYDPSVARPGFGTTKAPGSHWYNPMTWSSAQPAQPTAQPQPLKWMHPGGPNAA